MSALIKVTEIEVEDNLYALKSNSKLIVVPHITSFSDSVTNSQAIIDPFRFNIFKINKDDLTENEKSYGVILNLFSVEYTDTSDKTKYIHFEKKEDAENFMKELKSCINDFYNNADAYIKYLN